MELDFVNLGLRIAKRRKHLGMKQNMLAEKLEISNNYLSSIEHGKETPNLDVLIKICNALKVTPDYLLMGNMYSENTPQAIIDGLRLCSAEDIQFLYGIIQLMIDRHSRKWNSDNFV